MDDNRLEQVTAIPAVILVTSDACMAVALDEAIVLHERLGETLGLIQSGMGEGKSKT